MEDKGRNDNKLVGNIELQNVLGTDPNIQDKKKATPISLEKQILSPAFSNGRINENSAEESPQRPLDSNKKKKYVLAENEEFVEHKYVKDANDNVIKRKKVVKRITKKKQKLTIEQKEEIDNAFKLFDKDNSGSIDISELKDAMKALGIFLKKDQVKQKMT